MPPKTSNHNAPELMREKMDTSARMAQPINRYREVDNQRGAWNQNSFIRMPAAAMNPIEAVKAVHLGGYI